MAKLTAFVFVLIAATALASASAYSMEGSCERKMQQWMPMRQCMMYMQSRMRSPYNRKFREDYLSQCCSELQRVSSECRCDAVSEMMEYMPQMQYGQMEEMERMACQLPSMCGMRDCGCASY